MILHTKDLINDYWKVLNSITVVKNVQEEFFFLDPSEKKLYFTNGDLALQLEVEIEGQGNVLIMPKGEFLHLLKFSEKKSIILNDDHTYQVKNSIGKFNTNEKFMYMLESIKAVFNQKLEFIPYFRFSPLLWSVINKASIFVNPDDKNPQFQCLHIKNTTISSSSLHRMYINKNVNFDYEAILNSNLLRYMSFINPETLTVYKSEKSMLLSDGKISLVFSNIAKVEYLPVTEPKFTAVLDNLFSSVHFDFNYDSLYEALDYINYFSKYKINNCTHIYYSKEDNQIYLEVDSNRVKVDTINPIEAEDDLVFDFYFNSDTLLDILSKSYIASNEEFKIYANTKNNVYGLLLNSNEFIILGMIIAN